MKMPWWSWLLIALAIFGGGWIVGHGKTPIHLVPPISPTLGHATTESGNLAVAVGQLGLQLHTLADSLAQLGRPHHAAPLPPRPPAGASTDSLNDYIDTLEVRLIVLGTEHDALLVKVLNASYKLQAYSDSAEAFAGRLRALHDSLGVARDSAKAIEHERDHLARLVRAPRSTRLGLGGDAGVVGSNALALVGVELEVRRPVLFTNVEAQLIGGYGVAGNITSNGVQPGPGASLHVAITF